MIDHTATPWRRHGDMIIGGDGFYVAMVINDPQADRETEEAEANARVLLEAPVLRGLLAEFMDDWSYKIAGCPDEACVACERREDFLSRIAATIGHPYKRRPPQPKLGHR